jgi:predicted regulator of Ras-like GTPase activity (Roadblock/LC7/MglB family)
MATEIVEEILDSLSSTGGVIGVVVCTNDGIPIRDTFAELDRSIAVTYSAFASDLVTTSKPLFSPENDGALESIRIKTAMHELVIRTNGKYLIVVVFDGAVRA